MGDEVKQPRKALQWSHPRRPVQVRDQWWGNKSWLLAKYQSFTIDQIHLSRQGHDSTVSLLRVHLRCWKITSVLQFRGAYHKHQIKKRCFALLSISGSSTWNQDWGHRRGRSYIQSLKIRSKFQCLEIKGRNKSKYMSEKHPLFSYPPI